LTQADAKTPEVASAERARREGDYKKALEILRAPKSADAWLLRSILEQQCGFEAAARRSQLQFERLSLRRALRGRGSADRAARALDSCGRFEAALALYTTAGGVCLERAAELAAWTGAFSRAESLSRALPPSARAFRVLAAAAAVQGKLREALERAERALELDPGDCETLVWRAEVLRKSGRFAEASTDLERAVVLSRGFGEPAGAFLNRMLLAFAAGKQTALGDRERLRRMGVRGPNEENGGGTLDAETARRIEAALEEMKGNRSRTPTRVMGRRLVRFEEDDARGPGGEYARIQRYCLLGDPEKAVEEFGRIERSGAGLPRLWAYRGEVRLWQGLYHEAIADFEEALRRDASLPWPRIGKAGALTLLGDPAGALASLQEAARVAAPERLWTRRAEARLRSGDRQGALEDLAQITSGRTLVPSAWLIAALADERRRAERLEQLERGCAGFLNSAKRELGWTGGEATPLLERCLSMMRGNRSLASIGTYILASGEMRALPVDDEAAFAYRR